MNLSVLKSFTPVALAALLSLTLAAPARAESSIVSSASDSVSTSMGSLSDSVKGSSRSSGGERKVAAGDYRVTEVAQADGARLRLTLQRVAAAGAVTGADAAEPLELTLPAVAAQRAGIVPGAVVGAVERPYGVAFTAGAPVREPFFLAVTDTWMRELPARAVGL